MVIYQINVMAKRLHDGTELGLAWDGNGRDLRRSQIGFVWSSIRLIGHHAESYGQEEVASALEGSRVTPKHVEAFPIGGLPVGLEQRVVGVSASTAVTLFIQI